MRRNVIVDNAKAIMNITAPQPSDTLILVADDDVPTRKMLVRMLQTEGYQVEIAADGKEALEKYNTLHPDLMLLDALMPFINGFDVCLQLQANPGGMAGPIVMITALNDQESIVRALEAGAADYTTKPVHWPVLRQRIRRLLLGKEVENAFRKEQIFASTILDTVDALVFVRDSEGLIIRFNRTAERVTGYSSDEIIGKSWDFLVPPEEIEWLTTIVRNTDDDLGSERLELPWIAKDGKRVIVSWTRTILRKSDGTPEYVVGTGIDVTERRHVDDTIAAERNLLRTLIDNLPDYIFVKDKEGRFTVSNIAHSLAGQATTTDIVGKTAFESFPQDL